MSEKSYPVAPDSVYVWRGFKSASITWDQFASFLGTVFVPGCARLQPNVGLRAYLPSMVPQANKPAAVPDQTALMFWNDSKAHDLAKKTLAVRAYSNLHGDAYDMARSNTKENPVALDPAAVTLLAEQPYYLFDQPADWMQGAVHHLVGARRSDLSSVDFLAAAAAWAKTFRQTPPAGLDAALLCCGNDYLAAWVHAPAEGASLAPTLDGLAALTQTVLRDNAVSTECDVDLWEDWPGLDLTKAPCLNIRFHRPAFAQPRERGKS